jgi:hypothetical protein
LAKLVNQTKQSSLSKREAVAVSEFKKALKRRREGKPDDIWEGEPEDWGDEIL